MVDVLYAQPENTPLPVPIVMLVWQPYESPMAWTRQPWMAF